MNGLDSACAFIVGGLDGPGAAIAAMAQDAGMHTVYPYNGVHAAEAQMCTTPVCFFLFCPTVEGSLLEAKVTEIRQARSRKLRCSPLIYFSESPSHQTITTCMELGFDDIMTMPFSGQRMAARLARQLGRKIVYVESPGYFGPVTGAAGLGRARPLTILRHPEYGIRIMSNSVSSAA